MNLLNNFINVIDEWQEIFYSLPTFHRARDFSIGALCAPSPKTLTSIISFISDSEQDWSANYYFFSRSKWEEEDLFKPCIEKAFPYFENSPYLIGAMDDSALKKTGKKIKTAFWQRDHMSPAFHPNLIWGIRFIQISLTLPLYHFDAQKASIGIPVRWTEAPIVKKPKKNASKKEWEAFKKQKKIINLSTQLANELKAFREYLDSIGIKKRLLMTLDAAAATKIFLRNRERNNVSLVVRCRKDIQLCFKTKQPKNSQHFYDHKKFTPDAVYRDEKIPWKTVTIFRAGKFRKCKYKEVKDVYWQSVLQKERLKLLVLKRIPYYPRKGHVSFRDPAYLLCIDSDLESRIGIQAYHDHPRIEFNLGDEKSIVEIGRPRVRNPNSIHKQPAFSTAVYSALLIAYLNTPHLDIVLPRWRGEVKRVGVGILIKELKKELLFQFFAAENYKPPPKILEELLKMAS